MASVLRLSPTQDIKNIQTNPYPNIALCIKDDDILTAYLILTVESYGPMWDEFTLGYPLNPPKTHMDSKVTYLNIKEGGHICASSLDTKMSSTPTFTLKGTVIQLMSFVLSIESDR